MPSSRLPVAGGALVALLAAPPAPAQDVAEGTLAEALAAGDAHFARRAEGAHGGTAMPFHADSAIADYRRAVALDPQSLDARLRLLRAYFFRGGFCGEMDPGEKQKLFDEAKDVAEETVKRLDAELGREKGRVDLAAARSSPSAAEAYAWAAISWGQWAVFHKVNAAFSGAPGRIRDLAEAVVAIDPRTAQGAGYLILGRLNAEAPRIPFVTGWVSRQNGIEYLRKGLTLVPENPAFSCFLADALLRLDPSRREEAVSLLAHAAAVVPRPEYAVEDAHYSEMAKARLAAVG
jgi:tetratricopeptide (TPR) repeat protein